MYQQGHQPSEAKETEKDPLVVVEVYCTVTCPFCRLTRHFLQQQGIPYVEFLVDKNTLQHLQMGSSTRPVTVPQIFVGGYHVGGYEDLMVLNNTGELVRMLESALPSE
ncbi:MAG: glutaredoxin domain-containing protein [Gammaproteobacteria bacterium]